MKRVSQIAILLLGGAISIMLFNSCAESGGTFSENIRAKITEYLSENFSQTKDERLADETMKKIKKCIDGKDADAFKQLFCNEVINAEEKLEEQIQNLFDLLPNGIAEYTLTGDGGVSDGWEPGREYYEIIRKITVSDGTHQYSLVLSESIKDTANKDAVGIQSIYFYRLEDESLFDGWFYDDDYVGNRMGIVIYSPDRDIPG